MPSRRGLIVMTPEEQERTLEEGYTLQVASIGPHGYPHLVAMWYALEEGEIVFTTFAKSQKVRNLERDPKVTCMLESGRAYSELQGLVIEGDAELTVGDRDATAKVMGLVGARYSNRPVAEAPTDQQLETAAKRAVVRIKPRRIYTWDHTKLGGKY